MDGLISMLTIERASAPKNTTLRFEGSQKSISSNSFGDTGTTKASAIGKGTWRASYLRSSTTRSFGACSRRLLNSVIEIPSINRLRLPAGLGTMRTDADGCEIVGARFRNRRLLDRPIRNIGYVRVATAMAGVNQSNRDSGKCMVRSSTERRFSGRGNLGSHGAASSAWHDA